jgi:hypothetical protein
MQGVNVVARWVDPTTNKASGQYAASSVSGFLFRGDAGNAITGFEDATGQRLDRFGSDDQTIEGYFDLAGLEIPNGNSTATYEVSVEALDSNWSQGVNTVCTLAGTAVGVDAVNPGDGYEGKQCPARYRHERQCDRSSGRTRAGELFRSGRCTG